tara:strand:- start:1494 stop:2186 length:693 start_codon:yes stop_codon:yes gene_type:complete
MKLSDRTLNLLRNFSTINQSILFKQGQKLRTMSVMKNILAEANVDEDFPQDFGVYDLSQFLNSVGLFKEPEFTFTGESFVTIKEGRSRSKYFFADPSVIVSPPEKSIKLPSVDVDFSLKAGQLDSLKKAAAIYHLDDLSVVGDGKEVKLMVHDRKNDTSNDYSILVGETEHTFCLNFKVENVKIIPGSYEVKISKKLLSEFKSTEYDLTYYIALEPDITWEEPKEKYSRN